MTAPGPGTEPPGTATDDGDADPQFVDAEQWLAERGIERDRIRVTVPAQTGPDAAARPDPATGGDADATGPGVVPAGAPSTAAGQPAAGAATPPTGAVMPDPSVREARQLASETPPAVPGEGHDVTTAPGRDHLDLSDEVSRAVAFIQRSTASVPASTGRLRRKLAARDVPAPAIRLALEQAADQGLVDDAAFAASLADEGRAKGHADKRIRKDLRTREFDDEVISANLARHNDRDPEAVAFEVARTKAGSLRGVDSETAFRRLVGHLARRGHNEWVARKVAREVVFNELEDDVITGH